MLTLEVKGLKNAIRKLEKVAKFDINMGQISAMMYSDVINHFQTESSPRGRWPSIKRAGRILQDTGRLKGSILPGFSKRSAFVATNLEYARTHNEGDPSRNIKQRKYMYLSKEARESIKRFIGKQIGN